MEKLCPATPHPARRDSYQGILQVVATETLVLFEHLEFDVLALGERGVNARPLPTRTLLSVPTLLLQGHLRQSPGHARTPEHGRLAQLWLRSTAVERRGRSLPHRPQTLVDEVFDHPVKQAAARGLLDLTYRVDYDRRPSDAS